MYENSSLVGMLDAALEDTLVEFGFQPGDRVTIDDEMLQLPQARVLLHAAKGGILTVKKVHVERDHRILYELNEIKGRFDAYLFADATPEIHIPYGALTIQDGTIWVVELVKESFDIDMEGIVSARRVIPIHEGVLSNDSGIDVAALAVEGCVGEFCLRQGLSGGWTLIGVDVVSGISEDEDLAVEDVLRQSQDASDIPSNSSYPSPFGALH